MPHRFALLPLGALALAACEPNYVYRPAENATATIRGRTAADYQVPPDKPEGDVRIASFGIQKIRPPGAPPHEPNEKVRALHLRMVVANNGPAPWIIDTRKQYIDLAGHGRSTPAYVATNEGTAGLPRIVVPPGGKRTIDLFYPLPPEMKKASKIPEFDAIWSIEMPDRVVTERTPFDRIRIVPAYAYGTQFDFGYGYYGWGGGPFWYDPFYAGGFYGPVAGGPGFPRGMIVPPPPR